MSSSTNPHDEDAATGVSLTDLITRVESLESGATTENHNVALTSKDDADDHAPTSDSLSVSRIGLDENEQVHVDISYRSWQRELGWRGSDLLEDGDVQNIPPDGLEVVQEHLDHDIYCVSNLSELGERYRVLRQSAGSALEAANQTLASVVFLPGSKSHQQAQKAVSRFGDDVAAFNRDVNKLMLKVLLSDP